jgi:hypothetical protein
MIPPVADRHRPAARKFSATELTTFVGLAAAAGLFGGLVIGYFKYSPREEVAALRTQLESTTKELNIKTAEVRACAERLAASGETSRQQSQTSSTQQPPPAPPDPLHQDVAGNPWPHVAVGAVLVVKPGSDRSTVWTCAKSGVAAFLLAKAMRANDDVGIQELAQKGELFELASGTKVRVLEFSQLDATMYPAVPVVIRVLDGPRLNQVLRINPTDLQAE